MAWLWIWGLAACAGSGRGLMQRDAALIRFGVDPQVEAREVLRAHEQAGYRLHARIAGERFTAMGFLGADQASRGIRVVTVRGVALALDSVPKGALEDRLEYFLAMPPVGGSLDLDGDGNEELLVREVGRRSGACIVLYRVLKNGVVRRVEPDLSRFGADACVRGVSDVDADGVAELIAPYRVEGLPLATWPEVSVVLFADGAGGFDSHGPPEVVQRYYAGEIERRRQHLTVAQRRGDVAEVYRLASEIVLLWHLTGAARATELKLLDLHFAELPVERRDRGIESAIVARVHEGW